MFTFPWSNFHELNLDWILSVVKEVQEIFVKGESDIQHAVETADQALETAEQAAAGVIADGAVTIAKVNDEVFNLMAFIVSGSVTPVAIPAGSLVILRKSTVYNVSDGIYVATSDIPASSVLTAADLLQPSPLPDAGGLNYVLSQIGDTETAINAIQRGLVTVVDGDTATSAIPVGALAYLKNNTHNLQEGIYANISNAPFPTSGGTADSSVFSSVPNVLNSMKTIIGDGVLSGFTATDLTGAANELKQNADSDAAQLATLIEGLALPRTGDTASTALDLGAFISLSGNTTLSDGLYQTKAAIAQGATYTINNLTRLPTENGALNVLYDMMTKGSTLPFSSVFTPASGHSFGNLSTAKKKNGRMFLELYGNEAITTNTEGRVLIGTLSPDYRPYEWQFVMARINTVTGGQVYGPGMFQVSGNGEIYLVTGEMSKTYGSNSYPWTGTGGTCISWEL